jgi:hypothetical protein
MIGDHSQKAEYLLFVAEAAHADLSCGTPSTNDQYGRVSRSDELDLHPSVATHAVDRI